MRKDPNAQVNSRIKKHAKQQKMDLTKHPTMAFELLKESRISRNNMTQLLRLKFNTPQFWQIKCVNSFQRYQDYNLVRQTRVSST